MCFRIKTDLTQLSSFTGLGNRITIKFALYFQFFQNKFCEFDLSYNKCNIYGEYFTRVVFNITGLV